MENNNPNIQFINANQQLKQNNNKTKPSRKLLITALVIIFSLIFIGSILMLTRLTIWQAIYFVLQWTLPVYLFIWLVKSYFSSQGYRAVRVTDERFKIATNIISRFVLIIIATVALWILLLLVSLYSGINKCC